MIRDKIIPFVLTVLSATIVLYGIFFVPISKITIRIFEKEIFFRDINEKAMYIFLVLSIISIGFSITKYRIISIISAVISFIYMIHEIYELYNTYCKLGNFKDNIEILNGMYIVVIGNILLLLIVILNFIFYKKRIDMKGIE